MFRADEMFKSAVLAVRNFSAVSFHPAITTFPMNCRLQCKVPRDLCTERTDVHTLASAVGEKADGIEVEYICPTAYRQGEDISASFTSAEPDIWKAVNEELRVAMAVLFLLLQSSCSRQAYVSLHHTVLHVDVPLKI